MWAPLSFLPLRSRHSFTGRQTQKNRGTSLTIERLEDRLALSSTPWNPIGPAPIVGNTSDGGVVTGRVTAIAADPNPGDTAGNTVYIGTAGGGVWMGQNIHSGSPTWTPLTDNLAAQTGDPLINLNVGAIATSWDAYTGKTIIYAGLGEANSESDLMTTSAAASQFYGAGIIESVDGGQTWTLLGGQGSSNTFYRSAISKIVLDPTNPDNIYVAVSTAKNGVVGNEGIWHSADGVQSWVNTTNTTVNPKGIPGSTVDMFSDLVMDPSNDQVLYAAVGEATGSADNGVYMTTDGGTSWTKMTNLPYGKSVGRITLALSGNLNPSGPPQYELYAAFILDSLTQTAEIFRHPGRSEQSPDRLRDRRQLRRHHGRRPRLEDHRRRCQLEQHQRQSPRCARLVHSAGERRRAAGPIRGHGHRRLHVLRRRDVVVAVRQQPPERAGAQHEPGPGFLEPQPEHTGCGNLGPRCL
ncbi:MAG TPA: hypothetical protein VE999_23160 [Gemmataceae bacterium]|nr:hypothetical protein [Gemmataceae bacterium]